MLSLFKAETVNFFFKEIGINLVKEPFYKSAIAELFIPFAGNT